MGYTTSVVERFGWSSASIVGDNTAAIASVRNLSATPRAITQNNILRRMSKRLWWSRTLLHLFWVQSELMPADALSRMSDTSSCCITGATVDALSKWGSLMSNVCKLTHVSSA